MTWNISSKKTIKESYAKYLKDPENPENWYSSSDKTKWPPYDILQICFEVYRDTPQWQAMRELAMIEHGDYCWWTGDSNPEYHHWAYPTNAWTNCWADDSPDLIVPLCDEQHEFLEDMKEFIDSILGKAYYRKHRKAEYFQLMTRIFTLKDKGLEPDQIINQLKSEYNNDKT